MEVFVIHHIIRPRSVRRVSNGVFIFLLLVFVQVCLMLLIADSSLDLLVVLVFSFSLKCVQFLEEELSLSHLHMLSHTCFCPGGLPCWFFPPDSIIWFAAASAPCSDPCGSAVFACGCFTRGDESIAAPHCSSVWWLSFCSPDLLQCCAGGHLWEPEINDAPMALEEPAGKGVWYEHPVQLFRFAS